MVANFYYIMPFIQFSCDFFILYVLHIWILYVWYAIMG